MDEGNHEAAYMDEGNHEAGNIGPCDLSFWHIVHTM
jgi:hypothetical protein